MTTPLAILTITVAIAIIVVIAIRNSNKKKAFLRDLSYCQEQAPTALQQLKDLSVFSRRFTEAEEKQYAQEYRELYEAATRVTQSKYLKKEIVDIGDIKDFIAQYKGIIALREQNKNSTKHTRN